MGHGDIRVTEVVQALMLDSGRRSVYELVFLGGPLCT
jgi:hypothetical protein